ncbi:MAG: HAD family hydrolase [Lachnospiraceae bacterium]|nr:HAD family hydrolase [Lachnospiraceae bacterium]
MIKLIVSDVDDTLVPEGSVDLNPEYFDVIRKLQEKGVIFVGASGRPIEGVKIAFAPMKDEIFYIGDNGTDIAAGECVCTNRLGDENYRLLAEDLLKLNEEYDFMSCLPGNVYVNEQSKEFRKMLDSYGFAITEVSDQVDLNDITKVSLFHEGGVPEEVRTSLKEKWSDRMEVVIAGRVWLDFTAKGCNKGNALAMIQEAYGITPEETVAFGNADNDVSMIKQAKYGYAVADASEKLKKEAYEVIGSMEDDAVLTKLKEILDELK